MITTRRPGAEGGWWCTDDRETTTGHIRCDDCGEEFPFED